MVIAANSAEGTEAIEPSPSSTSLHGLDAVNLFLAGALSGFGPYVAVFLAEQDRTQRNIGFVLTAAGFAGLLSQIPGGELLDVIRSKRFAVALGASMVAAGTLIVALWPSFPRCNGRRDGGRFGIRVAFARLLSPLLPSGGPADESRLYLFIM